MLYERWRQVVSTRREEVALHDIATGRRWTFAQLDAAAERFDLPGGGLVCPRGHTAEFIIEILAAWRAGRCVCPLEPGQPPPDVPPPPRWCAHLKATSATSSVARLVAFRAEQLAADPANIIPTMGLRPDWPNLGVISMAHSYGFSNLVLPLLLYGVPLILGPSPLPEALRRTAAGAAAITLPAVPALWRAWHDADGIPPNVRLAISAGAPLPLPLERAVYARGGLKVHNFYGSSECGGIAYDRTTVPRAEATLAGTTMDQVSLTVAENGCLEVHGPNVAQACWPEDGVVFHGVFRTADLAELREGNVHLFGRASDVINVAGRKVAPEAIEEALLAHPLVREALALGLPGAADGREETIVAIVATAQPVPESDLRRFLLHRLPAWQIPREWHFVAGLCTNQRGKISRAEWRQKLATRVDSEGGSTLE